MEAHPRLTTGTLYRALDNVTTMKSARDILLSLAPSGFQISLSSCYDYTENYRKEADKLYNITLVGVLMHFYLSRSLPALEYNS